VLHEMQGSLADLQKATRKLLQARPATQAELDEQVLDLRALADAIFAKLPADMALEVKQRAQDCLDIDIDSKANTGLHLKPWQYARLSRMTRQRPSDREVARLGRIEKMLAIPVVLSKRDARRP
jgi:hypothetical protein